MDGAGNLMLDVRKRCSVARTLVAESGQVAGRILGKRARAQPCRRRRFAFRRI